MGRRLARARACSSAAACLLALGVLALPTGAGADDSTEAPPAPRPREAMRARLVYLRDVEPSIVQDMRYAGADNFTGRRVPGYDASECLLLPEAAAALARVQQALRPRKLSLKVYDCYRPRRAVRAFVAWVTRPPGAGDDLRLKRFHPNIERGDLIRLGYVAAVSRHSHGDTVDLTLVELPVKPVAPFRRDAVYGACTNPAKDRAPDGSVDMGTGYDCFDTRSHTTAADITPAQRRWRETLVEAMAQQGFRNYAKEWWHFTLRRPGPGRSFSAPILPRTGG